MLTKINFGFLFFLLATMFCYVKAFSQSDTIYLDELDNPVSKIKFYTKEQSSIYSGTRYSSDTLVLQTLRLNYMYDKMPLISKERLFNFLSSNYKLDTTKTIVIHYTNTLKNPKDYPNRTPVYKFDSLNNTYKLLKYHNAGNLDLTLGVSGHMHAQNYSAIMYGYKQCIKYHRKKNEELSVLHLYAKNEGFPLEEKGLEWYLDKNQFIKGFFKKFNTVSNIVIIQPNGEFYVQYCSSKYDYASLIAKHKWGTHKTEFLREIEFLNED
ncbi:hypothetical protein SAMN04487987_10993 [Algibacter pectinivorans]|uniref:Uncharacterized protein n=2 Tax=Algibacter pectinivorans TaxID=870482 RepID=A0A1I1RMR7_9FLAO|nr:hypothetical protein SAMN04487987_10993 [Algibacter pectinivorans]